MRLSNEIAQPFVISPSAAGFPAWTGVVSMWRSAGATPRNSPAQLERATGGYEGTVIIRTTDVPPPGQWMEARATYSFTSNTSRFNLSPPLEVGESFWFGGFGLFAAGYTGPVFSGDAVPSGFTQPEDFRARWVGAVNASDSVIEGERVAGFSSTGCVTICSTWDGKRAIRQISLGPSSGSQVSHSRIPLPAEIRSAFRAVGTIHALTASLASGYYRNQILAQSPIITSPTEPRAGSFPLALQGAATTNEVRFYGDGGSSARETWWTGVGLFAAGYSGEVFSGDAVPSSFIKPEDFRARWIGTPDASESVIEGERVRGIGGTRAAVIVSTRDDKPAIRIIALDATHGASRAQWSIPQALRSSGGVVMGTVHTDALPAPGSYDNTFRQAIQVATPVSRDQAPFDTGTFPIKVEFGSLESDYVIQLGSGGKAGHPDVWWTDIGLFDPGYYGGVFTGDTPEDNDTYYVWSGAVNNSTSHKMYQRNRYWVRRFDDEPWYTGEGHSGMAFVGQPTIQYDSKQHTSVSATFMEVGAWELASRL